MVLLVHVTGANHRIHILDAVIDDERMMITIKISKREDTYARIIYNNNR